MPTFDKISFQFGELRQGVPAAKAYANMVAQFVKCFTKASSDAPRASEFYDSILLTVLTELLNDEGLPRNSRMYEQMCDVLATRHRTLLEEEKLGRNKLKKFARPTKVIDLNASSSDSDDDDEETAEAKRVAQEEKLKREKEAYLEARRLEDVREMEREQNRKALEQRERKVDCSAFEAAVERGEVVLLNQSTGKRGGKFQKGGKNNNNNNKANDVSQEEVDRIAEELDQIRKEREVLSDLVLLTPEALLEAVEPLKAEIQSMEAEVRAKSIGEAPRNAGKMTKGQLNDLRVRMEKQRMQTDCLRLQLRASEPELGPEVVQLVQTKAKLAVQLLRAI